MSLKENINFVKEELNSEEKFIESFVKVERFYKKNKILVIVVVAVAVLAIGGITTKNVIGASNKKEANIAFNAILNDPNDKTALATLERTNHKLYEVAQYLKAKKENKPVEINVPFLKNLTQYTAAIQDENIDKLNSLSMQGDFLLKEFALFNKALILAKSSKYVDAKETLKLIPETSKVNDLVVLLDHYLLTK